MKKLATITIVILLAAACGCEHEEYTIVMSAEKNLLHRKLTVQHFSTGQGGAEQKPLPEERANELAKLYEKQTLDDDKLTQHFSGTFKGKTPSDVGGAGTFTHCQTQMGSLCAYVERFRGDDDLIGQVEKRIKAADRLTDILIGWLGGQLKGHKELPKLRVFLDKDLRRDLKNLSLYQWRNDLLTSGKEKPTKQDEETIVRMCQYLQERNYFRPEDIPAFVRLILDSNSIAQAGRVLADLLKAKAQIEDEALSRKIVDLFATDDGKETLAAYLKETPEYKARLAEYEKKKQQKPDVEKTDPEEPDPNDIISEYAGVLAGFDPFETTDKLAISLAAVAEPVLTNGKWDAAAKKVTWSGEIQQPKAKRLRQPTLCYAFWARPNEKFQKEHLGKVVLKDENLIEYCLRRKGLSPQEAKIWDEFVTTLRADGNPVEMLKVFQDDENMPEYLRDMAGEILSAMGVETKPATRPATSHTVPE